jgi:hypothetical protein
MRNAAIVLCAAAVLFGAPAAAEDETPAPNTAVAPAPGAPPAPTPGAAAAPTPTPTPANAQACLAKVNHDDAGLSAQTQQTRDQLVKDPSQIGAVVDAAGAASVLTRGEIELGIVRAVARLKCVDPAGYTALTDYLKAHPDNPIVVDINQAVNALGQVGAPAGAGGAPGGGAGGGGGGGGFSGGGSPSSPQ